MSRPRDMLVTSQSSSSETVVVFCVRLVLVVITMVTSCCCLDSCKSLPAIPLSDEKLLLKALIHRYENVTTHGRPVTMETHPVDVQFGLGLIQMDLDEKARALVLSVWIKMVWVDQYLTWEPEQFSNITSVKMESRLLWQPDIMLYNTAETETLVRDTFMTVFNNGTILWVPHQKLQSSCSIDVTNFPFDSQTCHMWFGSWTYTTRHLNITMAFPDGIDLNTYSNEYKESGQWEIMNLQAERRVLPSVEDDPNYSVLTFTLTLRRNIVFASYILTLPCVFLACLTLVVFWLPPDRPDRTALAMSTFSSFLLLLLILVEAAPPTASSVPRLGIYYCFNMVIIMMSIFLSSLVVNVCRMGEGCTPVPQWLRKVTIDTPLKRLCFCEGLLAVTWITDYDLRTSGYTNAGQDSDYTYPLLHGGSRLTSFGSEAGARSVNRKEGANGLTTMNMRPMTSAKRTNDNGFMNHIYQSPDDLPPHHKTNHYHGNDVHDNNATEFDLDNRPADAGSLPLLDIREKVVESVEHIRELLLTLDQRTTNCIINDTDKKLLRRDWRKVSLILDRVFFLLYLLLIIVSILTLFPRS